MSERLNNDFQFIEVGRKDPKKKLLRQRKREFVRDYRQARRALLAGTPIPFPAGTYWLRRFIGVEVAPFEKTI